MMWARILPDKLGRPTRISFSAHARKVLGANLYVFKTDEEKGLLIIEKDPDGRMLAKHGMSLGNLLDKMNAKRQLSSLPFPIVRVGQPVAPWYEGRLYEANAALKSNLSREDALPMALTASQALPRHMVKSEDLARAFALAAFIEGAPCKMSDLEKRLGLYKELPGNDTIRARFMSLDRFLRFVEFQHGRLSSRVTTMDDAKLRFANLTEQLEGHV